jgi:F-type H+-transporting ATPase subunit b
LYKPILNAIDVREKRIAKEVADASTKQKQAQAERDEFSEKNRAFEQARGALLSKATADAKVEHDRLLQEARVAADALSKSRHDALVTEAAQLNQSLLRRTQQEVFTITRKTLTDLADASLEDRVATVFIKRLATIDPAMKATVSAALTTNKVPVVIRSAFDLPPPQQAAIKEALNKTFATTFTLHFETTPDLVSGIDMMAGGQKLSWTIASYLDSLSRGVNDVLKRKTVAPSVPRIAPGPPATPIKNVAAP